MTSAQPKRTAPYANEIRWRMVYQYFGLQLSFKKIAQNLNVDTATVFRLIKRFEASGDVSKKPHPNGHDHHLKCLRKIDEFLILELVAEHPGIYLRELQDEVFKTTGTDISISSICSFL